ncbi:MAG TPA: SDR family oxidoreductase, partial [Pirellulales bacterium]|nr:SDR family oxidoreductase [Pirellulales bacterium]
AGLVATDSTRHLPGAQQLLASRGQYTLVGDRLLEARDVADAVLFLCSPLSDLVQGQTLVIDGGASIRA